MQEQKPFKRPSKKREPEGVSIVYEDRDIIVVNKVNGLLTMGTEKEKVKTAYYRLTDYVRKGNSKSRNQIFIVHRLDRDTSGLLVFAKTIEAKIFLQNDWPTFTKIYAAVVHGTLKEKEASLSSYIFESSSHKVYSVKDSKKGKFSKTGYKIIKENENYSLLEINLFTGRNNQIRVHLADAGAPIIGDKNYGNKELDRGIKRLGLHASKLKIVHPFSKKEMTFEAQIPEYFYSLVK